MSDDRVTTDELIEALRYWGDELQVTRALHAVCAEPPAARAFLRAILGAAGKGAVPLPRSVRLRTEAELESPVSRAYKKLGRADLEFVSTSGPDWRCIVECKINDELTAKQVKNYLGTDADLVIALTRKAVQRDISDDPRFGAALFRDVEPARRLPVMTKPHAKLGGRWWLC